jgi:hypothetical protein
MEEEAQINSTHHQRTRLEQANAAVLDAIGNQIVCIIGKDADTGVHLLRSSSFSLLDLLMRYDSNRQWLGILERHGYLNNFINDFERQDPLLAYEARWLLFSFFFLPLFVCLFVRACVRAISCFVSLLVCLSVFFSSFFDCLIVCL